MPQKAKQLTISVINKRKNVIYMERRRLFIVATVALSLALAGCKDKGHPQQEQQATENPAATGQGSVQQGLIKIENPEVRV